MAEVAREPEDRVGDVGTAGEGQTVGVGSGSTSKPRVGSRRREEVYRRRTWSRDRPLTRTP